MSGNRGQASAAVSDARALSSALDQLERSQWWTHQELEHWQFTRLQSLWEFTWSAIPFYRERYQRAGFHAGERLTTERWRELPLLTRLEVQQDGEAMQCLTGTGVDGRLGHVSSSGSTGIPTKVLATTRTARLWNAFTLREHYWHRRDFSLAYCAVRHLKDREAGDVVRRPDWGSPVNILHPTGPGAALSIKTTVEDQVEWLQRQTVNYLLTYPSNALALADELQGRHINLEGLMELRLMGETLSSQERQRLKAAWRVPVTDVYSCNELGYLALQCPEHEHYHVQSENGYLEVLNEAGEPCRPGEVGRIVVTPLHNRAMPLIRYELGDYAEVGEPCPCGRGLPVLRRILGRTRNMLVLPNGQRRWPQFGWSKFRELAPVLQHQLVQKSLEEIEVRFVVERALYLEEEKALRSHLQEKLGHPFRIEFRYPREIPRGPTWKYEEFISEVHQLQAAV